MRFGSRLAGLLAVLGTLALMPVAAAQAGSADVGALEAGCDAAVAEACLALAERKIMAADGAQDLPGARQLFDKACYTLQAGEGCLNLGFAWRAGLGAAPDETQALIHIRKACDLGNAAGCAELAKAYYHGEGVGPASPAAAFELYGRACTLGAGDACLRQGHMYAAGEATPADPGRALALYREACTQQSGAGCYFAGAQLYIGQGEAADIPGAVHLFREGCELGDGEACLRLGGELEFPDFGEADNDGALAAYARACEAGQPEGCEKAGIEMAPAPVEAAGAPMAPGEAGKDAAVIVTAYAPPTEDEAPAERGPSFAAEALPDLDFGAAMAEPEFLPEDEAAEAAAEMAEPAAEDSPPSEEDLALAEERRGMADACGRGDLEACEIFAAWLRDGTGGEADPVRARRIFSVICTEGSVKGCYELAWMMFDAGQAPEASPLELSRARFLFSETCKAGVIEACLQAGDLRREGVGGTVDVASAGRLYAIACEAGLEPACPLAAEGTPPAEETAAPEEADEAAAASTDDLPADDPALAEDETISD
ncbi:hypothetical protein ACQKH5_08590 [Hyphomonas sp. NPDC076900]|uniref:tetratricopeptide repeat protein n=1 Tax=unclassified Hyphomonas TaxID=2630699 RepID=UPI003CFBCFA9